MKITTRIKKIIQSNVLFVKTKIDSSNYKKKLTSIRANAKQGFSLKKKFNKNIQESNNGGGVYDAYESIHGDNSENNKYRTAKVIFQERISGRAFIRDFFLKRLSFLDFRKNHLKAMYATKKGYRTCDYSQRKGFYNFQ